MTKIAAGVPADVIQLFDEFAARIEAFGLVERPAAEPSFGVVNLLDDYNALAAIELLTSKAQTYYGHKEATFYAFCGWAVAPFESDVRFDFVGTAIKELLAAAELQAAKLDLDSNTATDMVARYYFAGSQFIWQIYTAFRGASSFRSFGSGDFISEHLTPLEADLKSIVKMTSCLHYVSSNRVNPRRKPSVNLGMQFLDRLAEKDTKSSTAAYQIWGEIKGNVALIYAASTINVSATETLLSVILNNQLSFARDYRFFQTWIQRAKFVCESILAGMSEELYEANSSALDGVEPQPFSFALKGGELKIINELLVRNIRKSKN